MLRSIDCASGIRIAALLLAPLAVACGGPKAVADPTKAPKQNLASTVEALVAAGFKCDQGKKDAPSSIICEQDDPKVRFLVGFEDLPARMVVALLWGASTPCDPPRLARMNLFHGRVDWAHASCQDKSVIFVGSWALPEKGVTSKDVVAFLHWWTKATVQAAAAAGIFVEESHGPPPVMPPNDSGKM